MGFESAHAARRRLALVAMNNDHVHEALISASFEHATAQRPSSSKPASPAQLDLLNSEPTRDVVQHLDQLAHDIIATPGAGGALLVAFAEQARALSLVLEAALRTQGAAMLPAEVLAAVQNALRTPPSMIGLELA